MRFVYSVVGGLALLTAMPAVAQNSINNGTGPDLGTARYSREDTLRAVYHLFVKRYRGAVSDLAFGTVTLGPAVASAFLTPYLPEGPRQDRNQDLVLGSLLTGYSIFRLTRFGPHQYRRVVEAYAQGKPLPQYLERRLKPKFFRYRPV